MHSFRNDYSELCHEAILDALVKAKDEQNVGYGLDEHSIHASEMIKKRFSCPQADVHFLVGGTQTNLTLIAHALRDYEAVIACRSGHINVHEAGSIETTGHKIFIVNGKDGKLSANDVLAALDYNNDEHMVIPKLVYISNSTETGTIYKKEELVALSKVCKENNLYLFIDGARLAPALTCKENDLEASDIARLSDAFYLGGTKNGLLFGEALVITNKELQKDFRNQIKNKGAMLAKGFISGIQFETILKDDLYFKIAKNANDQATYLYAKLKELGLDVAPVYTNQLFVTVNNDLADKIIQAFSCELWAKLDGKKIVRFVTSFKTTKEDVDEVYNYLVKNI